MKNLSKTNKIKDKNYYHSYPRAVALSFLGIILAGALLLMLPISSKDGNVSFLDALFTATSAGCVTGLVLFDTFTKWTLFGQIVILCLIQVGGLGFITIITLFSRFVKKHFSVREKMLLKESVGTIYKGDTRSLVKIIVGGTALFEIAGAILLSTQFIPKMGLKNGLFTSVFLSVSAFCNAGFDVMGRILPSSSLTTVNDQPVILLTICLLIIIGGIGFIVWEDILNHKFNFKRYNVHSKLVIVTTVILLFAGALLYFLFEYNNTLADMPLWQKIINAVFCSTTARTAGFNSIDNGSLTGMSKLLTNILMLIGGSSGSTAGGIKTTTFAVLFICVISTLKNKKDMEIFGRRISAEDIQKATAIFFINASEIFISILIITFAQPELAFSDILFECTSALGTVGMTAGITPNLETIPKIVILLMMYIGRITSLIFAFTLFFKNKPNSTQKPKGNLLIG